jgi:hypothetical protein
MQCNPLIFRNDYFLGELNASMAGFKAAIGDEIMQGNGTVGFATPLATLHLFEGWADKFLTTPAERISTNYGSEWDLAVSGKWHHFAGLLKYADYSAAGTTPIAIARDTRKFWAQLEYLW